MPECPVCGGELFELGQLGALHMWGRCRNCGIDVLIYLEENEMSPAVCN